MKTKKSLIKRFKVTKNKKILRRAAGQDHFLAKKSAKQKRKTKKLLPLNKGEVKYIKKLLKL
jgi:ribosomal protein L35